jgi:hypothetical protein
LIRKLERLGRIELGLKRSFCPTFYAIKPGLGKIVLKQSPLLK